MQTIATFSKAEQAHLLRMRLESVGIEAVLLDENMAQLEQPVAIGVGGVRLQVAEENVAAARELLAQDHGVNTADQGAAAKPGAPV
jgi:hypothetical protein